MTSKEMKKRLKRYSKLCQDISSNQKEKRISAILKEYASSLPRGNFLGFFCEQAGYLFRCCFLWQMLWLAAFCVSLKYVSYGGGEMLALLSALPAVLTLITVEEITKVYQKSMLEIEYATKYSLQNAVMIRMLVLCITHSIILAVGILILREQFDSAMGTLLVYGFTPMIFMTAVLLKLMKYFKGEKLRAAGIGIYAGMVVFFIVGNYSKIAIYRRDYFSIWAVACAAGSIFFLFQLRRLRFELKHFEQLIQYD